MRRDAYAMHAAQQYWTIVEISLLENMKLCLFILLYNFSTLMLQMIKDNVKVVDSNLEGDVMQLVRQRVT